MSRAVLRLERVSYAYAGTGWALREVELEVGAGDFIGVVGVNGSGKSTLLKLAAGLLKPVEGRVLLEGRPVGKVARRVLARRLGYLPQQVRSVFELGVEDVVAMGRFCHARGLRARTAEDQRVVEECMAATEVEGLRGRGLEELSGGERQRVLLASVLAQQPEIMLLDEPVTGLDLHHQTAFFKLLAECVGRGIGVVVITHDLNLASQFCGRILLLNEGRKEICDRVERVFERLDKMGTYGRDLAMLAHPVNGRPAVLPWNREGGTA